MQRRLSDPKAGNSLFADSIVPPGKGTFGGRRYSGGRSAKEIVSTGPCESILMPVFKDCLSGYGQLDLPMDCEPGKHQKIQCFDGQYE